MSRYFFNLHDTGKFDLDRTGVELPDVEAVRHSAMTALPDIARDEIPRDGDYRSFAVLVKDDRGRAIYSATLTYSGLWLER